MCARTRNVMDLRHERQKALTVTSASVECRTIDVRQPPKIGLKIFWLLPAQFAQELRDLPLDHDRKILLNAYLDAFGRNCDSGEPCAICVSVEIIAGSYRQIDSGLVDAGAWREDGRTRQAS